MWLWIGFFVCGVVWIFLAAARYISRGEDRKASDVWRFYFYGVLAMVAPVVILSAVQIFQVAMRLAQQH